MVRSRRARSRRAALEAARRQDGDGWRSNGRGGGRGLALFLIAVALVGLGFALGKWSARRPSLTSPQETVAAATAANASSLAAPLAREPLGAEPVSSLAGSIDPSAADLPPALMEPKALPELAMASEGAAPVVIVIDDLGRSVDVIDVLRGFGVPLTFAVLPFETRTAAVAARLLELGEEVLCHLPMEAQRGENPGPGALVETMSRGEIRDATQLALDAVRGAVGVNNHMGSAFSEDPEAMGAVLDVVRKRRLFFLDSRTSAASVGFSLALEEGVPAAERNVFLDRDRAPEAIRHELRRLLALANRGEPAIAIGHPYPETLAVLRDELPRALEHGYRFARVSDVLVGLEGAGGAQ
jgi:polysaccharide deacetylase 2 family uncharacterized protein YibQ